MLKINTVRSAAISMTVYALRNCVACVLLQDKQRSCLIGRSTGRKFRCPQGLSLPKDPEISTTHAEVRLCAWPIAFLARLMPCLL